MLKITNKYIQDSVHVVHCDNTVEEIKEDIANPYLVFESFSNFPRVHLLTSWSRDEALNEVHDYLTEVEGISEPNLIAVSEVQI